jgi:hypothetical protein
MGQGWLEIYLYTKELDVKVAIEKDPVHKKGFFWPFSRVFDKTVDVCAV